MKLSTLDERLTGAGAGSDLRQLLLPYKFGLAEILTKVDILREELTWAREYNPIEHVKSRLKSPSSIAEKTRRLELDRSLHSIRTNIFDIAGVRITCTFVDDVYEVAQMLSGQQDVRVVRRRDYIAEPKANGYRSLHLILEVPVFLSDRVESVPVEVQIRTAAMDFWASVEHKAMYKYRGDVPAHVAAELSHIAAISSTLDERVTALQAHLTGTGSRSV